MKYLCIVAVLRWVMCHAWDGILMDSDSTKGNTQLILPNEVPHTVGNVNFSLPHIAYCRAVVLPNGNAYFIGGYVTSGYVASVKEFNPNTNTTTTMAPLNVGRADHAVTAVGNTIIVCGGECSSLAINSYL
jgi:hypothetical protein